MNPVHLHLVFTHLPIVGFCFAILINLISLFSKSNEIKKLSLWFYILLGLLAVLAYITGDGAEKVMETYPGIGEDIIRPHERMALLFYIGVMTTTAIAITGLYLSRTNKKFLKKFNLYLLIVSLLLSFLAIKTGATGGAIRHTEIEQGYFKH